MFGSYSAPSSFENSDMKAKGAPSPEELALLEPFRGRVSRTCSASRSCRR